MNTIERLKGVPLHRGVEVDIREQNGQLCLAHDPFEAGQPLEPFLTDYQHAMIVLNVKCDGLERRILQLLRRYSIQNFFFLDVAHPTLVRLAREGVRQIAVRCSEYEPVESALVFAGLIEWVWIDCFTPQLPEPKVYRQLAEDFRICLVSPELQNHPRELIGSWRRELADVRVDAVCTDLCEDWLDER